MTQARPWDIFDKLKSSHLYNNSLPSSTEKAFFSVSIYKPKVTKQKHMQEYPGDRYLVVSEENLNAKYVTTINK